MTDHIEEIFELINLPPNAAQCQESVSVKSVFADIREIPCKFKPLGVVNVAICYWLITNTSKTIQTLVQNE